MINQSFWKGKRVLVTGGAGFIGSHLTKRLVGEGAEVTVFCLLQLGYGQLRNLKEVSSQIRFVRGDVRNFNSVMRVVRNTEIVFHLAAISHLPVCQANPLQAFEVNYNGTLNILEASRVSNTDCVVFAGSDHIYGKTSCIPINETHSYNGDDAYSLSKAESIRLCRLYQQSYGLDTRVLVSGNVFGEFQDPSKVVPIFINRALKNEPLTVMGGRQTRDFYYVGNLIDAYLIIASAQGISGESFNVGGDDELTIHKLAERVIELTKSRSEIIELGYRYDDGAETRLFLDKSKISRLGYKTCVGLDEGLKRTIKWYRAELKRRGK